MLWLNLLTPNFDQWLKGTSSLKENYEEFLLVDAKGARGRGYHSCSNYLRFCILAIKKANEWLFPYLSKGDKN